LIFGTFFAFPARAKTRPCVHFLYSTSRGKCGKKDGAMERIPKGCLACHP